MSREADRLQVAEWPQIVPYGGCQMINKKATKAATRREKLFIEQNDEASKQQQQQFVSFAHKNLLTLLLITMGLAFHCAIQNAAGQQQQPEVKSNLPTVIVRGFLNYRTTVDGTVLLFTPDAGGSSASQTNQLTISSSSPASLAAPNSARGDSIEPSTTRLRFASSTSFQFPIVEPQELPETPVGRGGSGSASQDEWRPVQATPPLRTPFQTAFRPSTQASQQPTPASQRQEPQMSAPSVQADDVIASGDLQGSLGQPIASGSSAIESPAGSTSTAATPARAARPKRPSLGFSGQGTRGVRPASRVQSSSQASGEPSNSINGIRKPGLGTSTSTTTSAPAPAGGSETSSPALGSFQSRLASARQRNRFNKRPPVGAGSNSSNSSQTGSAQVSLAPAVVTALLQPAESGEDLILSDQMAAQARGISPEQSSLQVRLGEVFAPSASPVVGNEEVWSAASESRDSAGGQSAGEVILEPLEGPSKGTKPMSRSGEQRPRDHQRPQLLSGGLQSGTVDLQQGQLSNAPLSFEGFFPSDQPAAAESDGSGGFQVKPEQQRGAGRTSNNDKLSGWMGQHNNKFIPRPQQPQSSETPGHLSHQLAANLNSLAPSFSSNIPAGLSSSSGVKPTPVSSAAGELKTPSPVVGSLEELESRDPSGSSSSNTTDGFEKDSIQLQTITKTYSTVMTSLKTRLVPLQVKSSTAIYTITENYVITKMLTAYQTMPLGEFILPEQSTRSPFEIFAETPAAEKSEDKSREQPIFAPSNHIAPQPVESASQPEQPISLDTSAPKSPNDWLHDFSNLSPSSQPQPNLANLLEQQAQEANLAGLSGLGEPLDQLASSLEPAADGTINIPDLNNPLVLAAAIQNPQLAAVILAAQQLQLKQRANKLGLASQQQALHPAQPLQPSYSTSLSTAIKPSTYTVRDTMYTTRLVSFKDGRTVRTRTVSEPGSVIEQVLTTMATEVTPVTVTIRPTAAASLPGGPLSTAAAQASNQNTINNALIATQLASLLARRQQQVQPSLPGQSFNPFAGGPPSAQPNQLAVLQQLLGQQQRQQQQQVAKYQPNIQQLLQSMQQPQQPSSSPSSLDTTGSNRSSVAQEKPQQQATQEPAATPSLPALAMLPTQPITTTLTSLQVRTYTVHNAFKTIYRTITSTQLITSTIFPGARNTQLPNVG